MKSFISILVAVLSLGLSGCESARHDFVAGVSEKINGPTFVRRVFPRDTPTVFEASRATLERLGFRITRAGAAQGVLEGLSGVASEDNLQGSRQLSINVKLAATVDGGTEVGVLFTEIIEADFDKGAGQATETSLRNHPVYERFFTALNQSLVR